MSDEINSTSIDSKYQYTIEDDSLSGIDVQKSLSLGIDKGVNITFKFIADASVNMNEYKAVLSSDASDPFFVDDDGNPYTTEVMPFTHFPGDSEHLYTINLYNVPASRYDDSLTLTVTKEGNPSQKYQIKFSVFSYAYAVTNDEATYVDPGKISPEKMAQLKSLLKAMYVFNEQAEAYVKQYPEKVFRYKVKNF